LYPYLFSLPLEASGLNITMPRSRGLPSSVATPETGTVLGPPHPSAAIKPQAPSSNHLRPLSLALRIGPLLFSFYGTSARRGREERTNLAAASNSREAKSQALPIVARHSAILGIADPPPGRERD